MADADVARAGLQPVRPHGQHRGATAECARAMGVFAQPQEQCERHRCGDDRDDDRCGHEDRLIVHRRLHAHRGHARVVHADDRETETKARGEQSRQADTILRGHE